MGQQRSRREFLRMMGAWGLMSVVPGVSPLLFEWRGMGLAPRATTPVTASPVLFGAWEPGPQEAVDALERSVGRPLDIVHWYQGWGAEVQAFDQQRAMATVRRNAMPLVTWEPWDYRQGTEQPYFRLRNIREGRFDPFLRTWARTLREFGRPIWLRFAHEMNGKSYPWSVGVNQNGAADYVAAWRHVVDIVREEGAAISPSCGHRSSRLPTLRRSLNASRVTTMSMSSAWTGITREAPQIGAAGSVSARYSAISTTKSGIFKSGPIIIAEVGCAEEGGDKRKWLADSFLRELPQRFPAVSAVVWFNERREADWRLDSNQATLQTAPVVFSCRPSQADRVTRGTLIKGALRRYSVDQVEEYGSTGNFSEKDRDGTSSIGPVTSVGEMFDQQTL